MSCTGDKGPTLHDTKSTDIRENFLRNLTHIHAWQASLVMFKSKFLLSSIRCTRLKNLHPCWQQDLYFTWK